MKKCPKCGSTVFFATQILHTDIIVDGNNMFIGNYSGGEKIDIYESEHPCGPYTCVDCSEEYEDLNELPDAEEEPKDDLSFKSEINGWICTDPDCFQYRRKTNDFSFEFIEIREAANDNGLVFSVSNDSVDIRDYSLDELQEECKAYYGSGDYSPVDTIFAEYGVTEGIGIIAECIFEQESFSECEYNIVFNTFKEAQEYLMKTLKKEK